MSRIRPAAFCAALALHLHAAPPGKDPAADLSARVREADLVVAGRIRPDRRGTYKNGKTPPGGRPLALHVSEVLLGAAKAGDEMRLVLADSASAAARRALDDNRDRQGFWILVLDRHEDGTAAVKDALFLPPTARGTILEETEAGKIRMQGTIRRIDLEGGFWGIVADDGEKYDPHGSLPEKFRDDGLRVRFEARPMEEAGCFHMWGRIVEITAIEAVDPAPPECPACKTGRSAIPILYQTTPETIERSKREECIRGGTCPGPDAPNWHCKRCGKEWR